MTASLQRVCWILVGLVLCAGCRSQFGTVYGVASGRTTAEELLPPRAGGATRSVAQGSSPANVVSQTAFAPPPVGALSPAEDASSPASNITAVSVPDVTRQNPLPTPTRDEATAAVLGDIQQLGLENPAAQQELLRQLQATDPSHWALIVKRFKSTLALHKQLKQGQEGQIEMVQAAESEPRHVSHSLPVSEPAGPASDGPVSEGPVREGPLREDPASVGEDAAGQDSTHTSHLPRPWQTNNPQADSATPTQAAAHAYPVTTAGGLARPVDTAPGGIKLASATEPIAPHDHTEIREAAPRDWRVSLQDAIASLEAQCHSQPLSTSEAYRHARLRLLALAADDLNGAVAPVPGLSPTEQDYWSKQLFAIATMLDQQSQPEAHRRASAAGMHLAKAYDQLQQLGSLAVRNLTFCDSVTAYGSYVPRKSRRFLPGEQVTLYVEVENFRSVETEKGLHTVIGSSYRVVDEHGKQVDGQEYPVVDDYCLSRRRDFHIQYDVTLPERIYEGEYRLELTLTDQLGNKIGRASIDFEIIEPTR